METREDLIHLLPEKIQRIFAANTPVPQRLMAARGLLPTTPENLVLALLLLQGDSDPNVAAAAVQSLQKMPENIMVTAINHPQTPGSVLVALAPLATVSNAIAQALIFNNKAPDALLVQIAATASEAVCELLANNQQRLLNCPQIAVSLSHNPQAMKSSIERIFDFLARNGVAIENCPELDAAIERLSPTELVEMANKVELPPELEGLFENLDILENNAQAEANKAAEAAKAAQNAAAQGAGAVKESLSAAAPVAEADQQPVSAAITSKEEEAKEEEGEKKRIPMMKLIGTLNTAQKVALATKGNKEARAILIKDANKMVATAVIKSPSITDQEIASAAASRSVNEDVIRIICKTNSMQRAYMVKVALVNNPRVPLPVAMKLLPLLRKNDIKMIAKSKDVPTALVNMAKKLSQS